MLFLFQKHSTLYSDHIIAKGAKREEKVGKLRNGNLQHWGVL